MTTNKTIDRNTAIQYYMNNSGTRSSKGLNFYKTKKTKFTHQIYVAKKGLSDEV